MAKRDWIYLGLMGFITLGLVADALLWAAGPPVTTWNAVIQSFGIMLFVYFWEIADANQSGVRRSSVARLLTFFLPPVGHAIYLYQGRPWQQATKLFLLFWAGVLGLALVGTFAFAAGGVPSDY
ncbi:hypothetical protein [Mycolicibacterium gadium]|jgi:hypothetical protein|uniref:hypothetical protein n=1 Tax=Mycolicibacterium gadium TaxID=1794 RepID=UPI002FDDFC7F